MEFNQTGNLQPVTPPQKGSNFWKGPSRAPKLTTISDRRQGQNSRTAKLQSTKLETNRIPLNRTVNSHKIKAKNIKHIIN